MFCKAPKDIPAYYLFLIDMIHCRFRLPWSSDWLGMHAIGYALEFGTVFFEKVIAIKKG